MGRHWILVGLFLSTVTGCAGDDDTPQGAEEAASADADVTDLEELDACTLLTAAEVGSATGYDVGGGTDPLADVSGAAPACAWPSRDGSVEQVAQVLISHATLDTFEEYRQRMAEDGITGFSRVDGPGRFTVLIEGMNMIQSYGDRVMVQVMVEPAEGIDPVVAATSLASSALERLEQGG